MSLAAEKDQPVSPTREAAKPQLLSVDDAKALSVDQVTDLFKAISIPASCIS